jgi:hypothetical protein
MIPHLVDFFIKHNDCAIRETDKKMFPIMDSLTPARRSVCLCDISCSTTAAASGSKSASFHPTEADREPVVFSMVDLISQSGPQLPVTNEPRSSACVQWTYCRQLGNYTNLAALTTERADSWRNIPITLKTTQSRRSHWRRPSRGTPPAKLRDLLLDFGNSCQAPVLTIFRVSHCIGEENKVAEVVGQVGRN